MRIALSAVILLALGVSAQNPVTRAPTTVAPTSTTATAATYTQSFGLAPSPTNSGVCTAHEDHWHCDGASSASSSSASEESISDTDTGGCTQHGNHFHCPAGVTASCNFDIGGYGIGLHVGALFALLAASALGVFVPVLAGRWITSASSDGLLSWMVVRSAAWSERADIAVRTALLWFRCDQCVRAIEAALIVSLDRAHPVRSSPSPPLTARSPLSLLYRLLQRVPRPPPLRADGAGDRPGRAPRPLRRQLYRGPLHRQAARGAVALALAGRRCVAVPRGAREDGRVSRQSFEQARRARDTRRADRGRAARGCAGDLSAARLTRIAGIIFHSISASSPRAQR